ncbi:MAG: SET domain-containing protein-lysine N-methyltransferase [Opitutae bacterium]|nr:SET domain-containing protein-lysine N-methyltransferase [Opitutae bacterium]HAD21143.1 SET domain-containing protein-lysine N-methyltransferase [Opitutae bacterium]|tara:strand:- start:443 stop:826 length:384 start_codon:yes stop_codon:yes gene_type:complete
MSKKWTADSFEIRSSTIPEAGRGLFSLVQISIEDTIGYYKGKILNNKAFNNPRRPPSDYILYLCNDYIIIGEGTQANYTRYINHSSKRPNAFLIVSTRWKTARFEAIDEINPGDEIFFNYGENYWES